MTLLDIIQQDRYGRRSLSNLGDIPWPRNNTTYDVLVAVMHEGPGCDDHQVFPHHPHPDLRELFSQDGIQDMLPKGDLPLASGYYWLTLLFTDQPDHWYPENYECWLRLKRCVRYRDLTLEEAIDYRFLNNSYKRVGGELVWDSNY